MKRTFKLAISTGVGALLGFGSAGMLFKFDVAPSGWHPIPVCIISLVAGGLFGAYIATAFKLGRR